MGIHKGTKLTDTPKDRVIRFRIDAATEKKLEELCTRKGKTMSEIIREGVDHLYQSIIK